MKTKYKDFSVKIKEHNDEEHSIEAVFSTEIKDRHGDVVASDWKLTNFKRNPVVQFGHRHDIPAVGRVEKISVNDKGQLEGKIKFAADEYEFANTLYKLYKNKFMRAISVGYIPHDIEEVEGDKGMFGDQIHKENELLEVSVVNVPANALSLAKQKGIDLNPLTELNNLVAKADKPKKCKECKPQRDRVRKIMEKSEQTAKEMLHNKDVEIARLKKKVNRLIKEKKELQTYSLELEEQLKKAYKPKKKKQTRLDEAKEAIEKAEKPLKHQDPVKLVNKAVRLLLDEKKTIKKDKTSA